MQLVKTPMTDPPPSRRPRRWRIFAGRPHATNRPIELRIQKVGQLFQTLDPLPFRERDIDASVEEYVVGWAGEMAVGHSLSIIVHLPWAAARDESAAHIGDGFRNYFGYRAEVLGWDLHRLFQTGRASLATGLLVLGTCILVGERAEGVLGDSYLARFFTEGLVILGWVANWRPIEIFLYDWWPIVRRRALYRRLAQASVEVQGYEPGHDSSDVPAAPGPAPRP